MSVDKDEMAWRDRALGRTPRWSVVTNGDGVSLHPCLARPTGSWLAAQAWLVPQPLAFAASAEAWVRGRVSAGASEAASLIQWGRPPVPLLTAGPESSGGSDWRLSPPRGPHPQAPASWPRSAFPRCRSSNPGWSDSRDPECLGLNPRTSLFLDGDGQECKGDNGGRVCPEQAGRSARCPWEPRLFTVRTVPAGSCAAARSDL